ncbi:MAG TPA: DUF983 domain-containing protein [Gemmatimonadales bacterium]|jgi:uncharacterized protein (DUF983 family)|nr:DUF983 domain-containing protein [Gemmatimonadales bacterium]
MPAVPEWPAVPPRPAVVSAFWRAARLHCPACGGGPVFLSWIRIAPACPSCGLNFTRGERGYWLGAYFVNLMAVEAIFAVMLGIALWWTWPTPPWEGIEWALGVAMLVSPFLLYPWSHTIFLAFDLLFRPPASEDFEAPHEPAPVFRRRGR